MFRETFVNGQCDFRFPVRLLGDGRMSVTISQYLLPGRIVSDLGNAVRAGDHPHGFDELRPGGHATQGEVQLEPNCDGYWGAESPTIFASQSDYLATVGCRWP